MSIKDFSEIVGFLVSLLVVVWKIAEVKAKLEASTLSLEKNFYKDLELTKDSLEKQIAALDKALDRHIQSATYERDIMNAKVADQHQDSTEAMSRINKRISGAIVFERMEQRIITLSDAIKNQGHL
ncbi:hypothetical protein Cylst_2565 [Cylindrospermum stagnale PCC 7417]|uniref:Uncharacterized protein n=1 Tax=Cylindrospermum stagnale PCC 7417 TaxID=56107 RepID=K9WY89_9NOST|nr:hypothetical protein [Cylindrospermum stagnale]AFZ24771.1 hypothetical protein Cylst_2565 [Cylindrospermum stagnale PCC 7417]